MSPSPSISKIIARFGLSSDANDLVGLRRELLLKLKSVHPDKSNCDDANAKTREILEAIGEIERATEGRAVIPIDVLPDLFQLLREFKEDNEETRKAVRRSEKASVARRRVRRKFLARRVSSTTLFALASGCWAISMSLPTHPGITMFRTPPSEIRNVLANTAHREPVEFLDTALQCYYSGYLRSSDIESVLERLEWTLPEFRGFRRERDSLVMLLNPRGLRPYDFRDSLTGEVNLEQWSNVANICGELIQSMSDDFVNTPSWPKLTALGQKLIARLSVLEKIAQRLEKEDIDRVRANLSLLFALIAFPLAALSIVFWWQERRELEVVE